MVTTRIRHMPSWSRLVYDPCADRFLEAQPLDAAHRDEITPRSIGSDSNVA